MIAIKRLKVRDKTHQAMIHAHGHMRAAEAAWHDGKPGLAKYFVVEANKHMQAALANMAGVEATFSLEDVESRPARG